MAKKKNFGAANGMTEEQLERVAEIASQFELVYNSGGETAMAMISLALQQKGWTPASIKALNARVSAELQEEWKKIVRKGIDIAIGDKS